jgi:hypothetical protein
VGAVAIAALLPWTPWLAFSAALPPTAAYYDMGLFVFAIGAIALGGAAIAQSDKWLGGFVIATALLALLARQNVFHAAVVLLGAGTIVAVRAAVKAGWGPWLVRALVFTAMLQSLLALGQAIWWRPEWGVGDPILRAYGTFGNSKYMGAMVALVTPLAPLWALPVLAIGLGLSQSAIACLAALAGLLVRPDVQHRGKVCALLGLAGAVTLYFRSLTLSTVWERFDIWRLAFSDLTVGDVLLGNGPGSWFYAVPAMQAMRVQGEAIIAGFRQAHNEPVQLAFEMGVVGLVLLAGWLWAWRGMWRSSARGAAVASVVLAGWWSVYHIAVVAPVAVVVLGLVTAEDA